MNSHYRFYDLDYFFRETSALGFQHCELWTSPHHFFVDARGYEDIQKLRILEQNYQMKVICICPEQTNPKPHNIATAGKERMGAVLSYFKNMIDISARIGAHKVVITSGWAFYNEEKARAYERSVLMMKQICDFATERGVELALEALQPDESVLVNTVADIQTYRADVGYDCLKVCIDMGAMARGGETIGDYFEAFREDVIHVHFVDGNPCGHLAWGDGTRDMRADIEDFKKYGYEGFLSLENATSRYFERPVDADRKSIADYMKKGGE